MCSAKKVKQVANIAAAVVNPVALATHVGTLGAAKGVAKEGSITGAIPGFSAGVTDPSGTIMGKPTNPIPTPEDPIATATPEPPATPAPGISNLAEQRRRKRLNSLRMGILGNIRAGGTDTTANLLTPAAGAGGKTLLGQ